MDVGEAKKVLLGYAMLLCKLVSRLGGLIFLAMSVTLNGSFLLFIESRGEEEKNQIFPAK